MCLERASFLPDPYEPAPFSNSARLSISVADTSPIRQCQSPAWLQVSTLNDNSFTSLERSSRSPRKGPLRKNEYGNFVPPDHIDQIRARASLPAFRAQSAVQGCPFPVSEAPLWFVSVRSAKPRTCCAKIRYIHARKLVPSWKDENPRKALV